MLQCCNVTLLQPSCVNTFAVLSPPFLKCVTKCITLCYTTPNTIGCVECNLPWARLHSQAIPPPHHYHCTPHNHRHNQGGEKYFTSWEPRFLGQYFARDSVIHGPAGADKKLILVKRNQFLSQEINSCHKKSILAPRNQFLPQEINSCHKKSILVTRNHFL